MNKEIWKNIVGYEGSYQISNKGRVKSLNRKMRNKNKQSSSIIKERFLKPTLNVGYLAVSLSKKSKTKTFKVHRLVALHFVKNTFNKPQVNHIDGDKLNNKVENLEWLTASENCKHAWDLGIFKVPPPTFSIENLSFSVYMIKDGKVINEFYSVREASRQTKFSRTVILKCCRTGYEYKNIKWKLKESN
jgi:hypothetical protein